MMRTVSPGAAMQCLDVCPNSGEITIYLERGRYIAQMTLYRSRSSHGQTTKNDANADG